MNRFDKIAAGLGQYGVDAMLITSQPGEFYAAGFSGEGVVLVAPGEAVYITDSRYIEAARNAVSGAEVLMVERGRGYTDLLNEAIQRLGLQTLGVEEDYLTLAEYDRYKSALRAQLVPAGRLLLDLRGAKDDFEIHCITQAQRVTERAFEAILPVLRPGVTEREVAAQLTYDMLRFGAAKNSFDPIVVSGPNGSLPHGVPGDRAIQSGDFVTMDFGCVWGGYCSDMTRTVAVGRPSEEMMEVYDLVLRAQLAGIAASRAGVPGREIDAAARAVIQAGGYGPYFGHSYGHSVGLEIHEGPNANTREERPMPVGAVVSAEPGVYLPGKFGVRIEDLVVMEENGCRVLTQSPKNLLIL